MCVSDRGRFNKKDHFRQADKPQRGISCQPVHQSVLPKRTGAATASSALQPSGAAAGVARTCQAGLAAVAQQRAGQHAVIAGWQAIVKEVLLAA